MRAGSANCRRRRRDTESNSSPAGARLGPDAPPRRAPGPAAVSWGRGGRAAREPRAGRPGAGEVSGARPPGRGAAARFSGASALPAAAVGAAAGRGWAGRGRPGCQPLPGPPAPGHGRGAACGAFCRARARERRAGLGGFVRPGAGGGAGAGGSCGVRGPRAGAGWGRGSCVCVCVCLRRRAGEPGAEDPRADRGAAGGRTGARLGFVSLWKTWWAFFLVGLDPPGVGGGAAAAQLRVARAPGPARLSAGPAAAPELACAPGRARRVPGSAPDASGRLPQPGAPVAGPHSPGSAPARARSAHGAAGPRAPGRTDAPGTARGSRGAAARVGGGGPAGPPLALAPTARRRASVLPLLRGAVRRLAPVRPARPRASHPRRFPPPLARLPFSRPAPRESCFPKFAQVVSESPQGWLAARGAGERGPSPGLAGRRRGSPGRRVARLAEGALAFPRTPGACFGDETRAGRPFFRRLPTSSPKAPSLWESAQWRGAEDGRATRGRLRPHLRVGSSMSLLPPG